MVYFRPTAHTTSNSAATNRIIQGFMTGLSRGARTAMSTRETSHA